MGTRNLTMVVLHGEPRIAQYGQWDGYPSGQGCTALNFLRSADLAVFKEKVGLCRFGSDQEIKALWERYSTPEEGVIGTPVEYLSRDTGAEILRWVYESETGLVLRDSRDFAADSLMCEWAYVIDLDHKTIEVYKGFNQEPLDQGERFANYRLPKDEADLSPGYYPVRHVVTFRLEALPGESEFVELAEPSADE